MEQDYLKRFDEIFGTKTNKNIRLNMPILENIFENFGETLYTPSKRYDELSHKKIEILNEMQKTFTPEQKEMFDIYHEIENQISIDVEEQLFMFGYILGNELKFEAQNSTTIEH